jgi:hypothetical protein
LSGGSSQDGYKSECSREKMGGEGSRFLRNGCNEEIEETLLRDGRGGDDLANDGAAMGSSRIGFYWESGRVIRKKVHRSGGEVFKETSNSGEESLISMRIRTLEICKAQHTIKKDLFCCIDETSRAAMRFDASDEIQERGLVCGRCKKGVVLLSN